MTQKYAWFLCLGFMVSAPAGALDTYVSYSGVARARHSSDFYYGERHLLRYRDGRLEEREVLYTCRDGAAFAHKSVRYVDGFVPDFAFEDARNGMREGIRQDGASAPRVVFYRERTGSAESTASVPAVPGLIADAGFDEFVKARWDALMSDKALDVRFLLPSRLKDYGFEVRHLRADTVMGVPVEVFRLRLSGIWGYFLPGIDVFYRASDRVLVRYDGLSDLHDTNGDNYKTVVDFAPSERRAADARAMAEMRNTPIAPCPTTP